MVQVGEIALPAGGGKGEGDGLGLAAFPFALAPVPPLRAARRVLRLDTGHRPPIASQSPRMLPSGNLILGARSIIRGKVMRMTGSVRGVCAVWASCVVAAYGCGGAPPASVAPADVDPCVLAEEPLAGDTLVFALPGPVDPAHAPVPTSFAERVVFRSLYETLIRVDCRGDVHPGLAVAWRPEDGGRTWVFELRPAATFADGLPVTAEAVVASWREDEPRRPRPWADSVETSATARDEHTLAIALDRPHASVPRIFAHPGLAVARPAPDGAAWALGTGSFTVAEASGDRLLVVARNGRRPDERPALAFRTASDDPRDLVDAGADLMVTSDPAVSAYATAVADVRVIALPWDRVYVLAVPSPGIDSVGQAGGGFPDDLSAAATGADAKVPAEPYWWHDAGACLAPRYSRARRDDDKPAIPRILYWRDDRTARGLAERVVALVAPGRVQGLLPSEVDVTQIAAAGLESPAYEVVLRDGGIAAYVVALDRAVLDTCVAAGALVENVTWPARIVPLVETRSHLVIRQLAGTLALEWDGTPYLTVAPQVP